VFGFSPSINVAIHSLNYYELEALSGFTKNKNINKFTAKNLKGITLF
jgi:hypothetical protein